jgi:hypothetical protein
MKSTPEAKKQQLLADLGGARQEVLDAAMELPVEAQDRQRAPLSSTRVIQARRPRSSPHSLQVDSRVVMNTVRSAGFFIPCPFG